MVIKWNLVSSVQLLKYIFVSIVYYPNLGFLLDVLEILFGFDTH